MNCVCACADVTADIVFVVERSAFVGQTNFQSLLVAINNIVNYITYGTGHAQYGLMVFGNNPTNIFTLNNGATDLNTLYSRIMGTQYSADGNADLNAALSQLTTQQFTAANGDRPNAANVAVIIMASSTSDSNILNTATTVKAAGIKLLSIAVGSSANVPLLQSVSSPPQQLGLATLQYLSFTSFSYTQIQGSIGWLAKGNIYHCC